MTPTSEQTAAIEAFGTGGSLVIEAGAGCGKTTVLSLLAHSTPRRGQYLAFNRALINDAAGKFPDRTAANTIHSLAFRAVGKRYKSRLDNSARMSSAQIARILRIDPFELGRGVEFKRLAPGFLAGHVLRGVERFCQSADPVPTGEHVPYVDGLDLPDADGRKGWANNRELRRYLAPFVTRAWLDLCELRGALPFKHSHYLKLYELGTPVIDADYLLWDECFPAGTMVETHLGAVPIEKIAECPSEPWSVLSSNDGGKTVQWSNVTSAYRTPRVGALVRIHHDGGALTCTANHPLWVEGQGWTPAALVAEGDALRHLWGTDGGSGADVRSTLRDDPRPPQHHAGSGSGAATEDLQADEGRTHGDTEPDARPGHSAEGVGHTTGDRSPAISKGRQRPGRERAGTDVGGSLDPAVRAEALAPRVCRLEWTRVKEEGTPSALQDRSGVSALASGGRDRRGFSQLDRAKGKGPQEGARPALSRVARVEVLESDGDGRPGRRGDGDSGSHGREVFTLSVEAGCYFAAGVLVKNCQDVSPVMESIVVQQRDTQVVAVGDPQQALYEWMGSHDALTPFKSRADHVTTITQSFRFGPAIAEAANVILVRLASDLRLRGLGSIDSTVTTEALEQPHAVLCRTNATSVRKVLTYRQAGKRVALVGDGTEVLRFARAAQELQQRGSTSHPDLACFSDWPSVQHYVIADAMGGELRLMVNLVDEFGVPVIESALSGLAREDAAEVVVSTGHRGKGRQWPTVQLADDFPVGTPEKPLPAEELRLQYVAVTRAQHVLDLSACPTLATIVAGEEVPRA